MPGAASDMHILGRHWRWTTSPPRVWRILAGACLINFLATFILLATVSFWGTTRPTERGAPIKLKGGVTYYGPPTLVLYTKTGIPIGFGLLGAMALVAWTRREDLERVR